MNSDHARVCGSQQWADHICQEVLPVATAGLRLGDDMLEVGPGPGAATGWLSKRVARLTALESDPEAAAKLAARHPDVSVVTGDAAKLSYPDGSFDCVGSFTMLHHVPTSGQQYRLLAETRRVLRPGGVLIGSDSLPSDGLHQFHECDTYNPVVPAVLLVWLQALDFGRITFRLDDELIFTARKPVPGERECARRDDERQAGDERGSDERGYDERGYDKRGYDKRGEMANGAPAGLA